MGTPHSLSLTPHSALSYAQVLTVQPNLNFLYEGGTLTLYWNGSGFTLQQTDAAGGSWSNTTFNASPVSVETPYDLRLFQLHK